MNTDACRFPSSYYSSWATNFASMGLNFLTGAQNDPTIFETPFKLQARRERGGWNFQTRVSRKKMVRFFLIGYGCG
jgi:hypothetical protein